MASLRGFIDAPKDRDWQEHILLREPPAGQHAPYIEPVGALEKMLRRQGVAPKELATDAWVKQATHTCRGWTVRYVYDGKLDDPIDILAGIDSLHVIANEPTPESGLGA